MKSIFNTIVSPKDGLRYNNKNKSGITLNTSIYTEDHHYTNRIAVVEELPMIDTELQIGDEIIVHHNVFRKYWGFSGHLRTSSSDINDGKFKVSRDQMYAYRRDGKWNLIDDWCFVKPVEAIRGDITYDLSPEVKLQGTIALSPLEGFKIGQKVIFKPNSEYEFNIDGEKVYRMRKSDLTALIL